jgi:alkanesulfonate monooxygenase SsuD/methylene tetrahydromethanopterin reductase-like flavin-dependent oxidoreductase (luciferase family)
MQVGLFCNQQRARPDVAESWQEDMNEIVLADQLGLDEAWISEHTGSAWLPDALPSPDMMIAALSRVTHQIRLGPAIRRLALYHPLQVAVEIAVCDQLTHGRYMFGFGRGGPVSGWGQRGTDFDDTHEMMVEGIDLIHRIFTTDKPFTHEGKYYRGKDIEVYPKPVQAPHPPISVATGNPVLLKMAVERGFHLLTSQFATPGEVNRVAGDFQNAGEKGDRRPSRADLTAVRGIFIADTDAKAIARVEKDWQLHIDFNKKHFPFNFKAWTKPDEAIEDVNFAELLDRGLMFIGSADTVRERLREFYVDTGGFGVFLLVTGRDWGTYAQRRDSMEAFAQDVMPAVRDFDAVSPASAERAGAAG